MALVISIKEDGDFYVQDTHFIVRSVGPMTFMVQKDGGNHDLFCIDDHKMTEIMPRVKVSCGLGNYVDEGTKKYVARVVFEAPREIIILRGDMYRRGKQCTP